MGKRIDKRVAVEIKERLSAAAKSDRSGIITDYAESLGVSRQSVYNAATREGWNSGRPTRADHGCSRVPEDTLMRIAAIVHASRTLKDHFETAAWNAIRIAKQTGIPGADQCTVSILYTYMQRHKMSTRHATHQRPHQEMRTAHSNEVHQIDTSVFAPVYLSNTGKLCNQTPGLDSGYKNKASKGTPITRYVCTDHASGAFFVWYFAGPENARDMLRFLHLAWGGRHHLAESDPAVYTAALRELAESYSLNSEFGIQDSGISVARSADEECPLSRIFPFRGIPRMLYTDNGSSFTSRLFETIMSNLCVERHDKHSPGNSRASGSVEKSHHIWQCAFESLTRHLRITTVEQLNTASLAFCAWFNAERKHRRHGRTRTAAWAEFLFDYQLREMPEYNVFRALAVLPRQVRKVKGGCFTLAVPSQMKDLYGTGFLRYRIADPNVESWAVEVVANMHDYPNVRAFCPHTQQWYQPTLVQTNALGFDINAAHFGEEFKRHASSDTERAIADLSTIAMVGGPELVRLEKPRATSPAQQLAHQQALAESQADNIVSLGTTQPILPVQEFPAAIHTAPAEAPATAPAPVAANSEFEIQNSGLSPKATALIVSAPAITSSLPAPVFGAAFVIEREPEAPLSRFAAKAELLERVGRAWDDLGAAEQELINVRTAHGLTPTQVQELAAALRAGDAPPITQIQTEGA